MAKSETPPISEETIEMIEGQVKKGKARKFFLICKGVSIKTLVVFKKGAFGPKVMQAKKDGFKGDVVYGVVTGSGKNLFFQLPANDAVASAMKVDGATDKPPTKKAKLREFLGESGLSFKPVFHMVTKLEDAPDPDSESDLPVSPPIGVDVDDDEDAPASEAPAPPGSPRPSPEAPPQPPGQDATSFATRLKRLKPELDRMTEANVSVAVQAKQQAVEAAGFARQSDFGAANSALDRLEETIRKGLLEMAAAGDAAALFKQRFQQLAPSIKAAAGTAKGDEAKLKASEAAVFSRKQDFEQANALLDEAEKIIQGDSEQSLKFTERCKSLEPSLLEAQRADRDKATKLGAAWAMAIEHADAGNFDKALAILDRLEKAIETTIDNAKSGPEALGIETGTVAKRKFLVTRFKEIPLEIQPHLQSVKLRIAEDEGDDDPGDLVSAIEEGLRALYDELQDEIDKSINLGDSSVIAGLKDRVRSDDLVQHLLKNPFVDGTKFQSAILNALDEVEQQLTV